MALGDVNIVGPISNMREFIRDVGITTNILKGEQLGIPPMKPSEYVASGKTFQEMKMYLMNAGEDTTKYEKMYSEACL